MQLASSSAIKRAMKTDTSHIQTWVGGCVCAMLFAGRWCCRQSQHFREGISSTHSAKLWHIRKFVSFFVIFSLSFVFVLSCLWSRSSGSRFSKRTKGTTNRIWYGGSPAPWAIPSKDERIVTARKMPCPRQLAPHHIEVVTSPTELQCWHSDCRCIPAHLFHAPTHK